MTSFTDIPLDDIKEFLIANDKINTSKPYLDAWNLINNNKSIQGPPSISDFFLAQNISKMEFPSYKISKILTSDVSDLIYITALQDLPKNRIIRVLKYLNKLENDMDIFDMLPKDISQTIISKLDIHSIQLICEISYNFSKFCRTHLQPILLQNLKCKTNINISNFSIKQLLFLDKNLKADMDIIDTSGYYHSLILKDNKIYDGSNIIEYLDDIIQIATSNNHALALTAEGEVFSFGNNDYGQLGLGHNFECSVPQLINNISDVICVSVSDRHSLLLMSNGNVYMCGNYNNIFEKLDLDNVIQISAGFSHSLALTKEGKIYLLDDSNISIKLSDLVDQISDSQEISNISIKLLMENSDIISISTGYDHSLLLDKKGIIYGYGNNEYGQLGLNEKIIECPSVITGLDNIVHIVAGDKYSLIMTNDGGVFKFGLEDDKINYSPIKISIPDIIEV
jgi:hypothetical protein